MVPNASGQPMIQIPLREHRLLIYGQGSKGRGHMIDRDKALDCS